jgi:enoyl-CoA hydratase/carnithine racemase
MAADTVRIERTGRVTTVILNRPDARNAVALATIRSGEAQSGATQFVHDDGRGGRFDDI